LLEFNAQYGVLGIRVSAIVLGGIMFGFGRKKNSRRELVNVCCAVIGGLAASVVAGSSIVGVGVAKAALAPSGVAERTVVQVRTVKKLAKVMEKEEKKAAKAKAKARAKKLQAKSAKKGKKIRNAKLDQLLEAFAA